MTLNSDDEGGENYGSLWYKAKKVYVSVLSKEKKALTYPHMCCIYTMKGS